MRITHLGHACLLVETADTRLLIDPGSFSPAAAEQRDLHGVLITHQHPDHVDLERLPDLLRHNPAARLVTDADTAGIVGAKGLEATALAAGQSVQIGAVSVTGAGDLHALIHTDIPRIHNTGMRLTAEGEPTFYHPGDALDADFGDVDVLAFPLSAPWAASRDTTDFLRRHHAPYAVPVHDGLLSAAGRGLYLGQAGSLGSPDTQIRDLADGTPGIFSA